MADPAASAAPSRVERARDVDRELLDQRFGELRSYIERRAVDAKLIAGAGNLGLTWALESAVRLVDPGSDADPQRRLGYSLWRAARAIDDAARHLDAGNGARAVDETLNAMTALLAVTNRQHELRQLARAMSTYLAQSSDQRRAAGRAGRGRPKRPHNELIRRIARRHGASLPRVLEVLRDEDEWADLAARPPDVPVIDVVVDDGDRQVTFRMREVDGETVDPITVSFEAVGAAIRRTPE
jgi:hypothetical protein